MPRSGTATSRFERSDRWIPFSYLRHRARIRDSSGTDSFSTATDCTSGGLTGRRFGMLADGIVDSWWGRPAHRITGMPFTIDLGCSQCPSLLGHRQIDLRYQARLQTLRRYPYQLVGLTHFPTVDWPFRAEPELARLLFRGRLSALPATCRQLVRINGNVARSVKQRFRDGSLVERLKRDRQRGELITQLAPPVRPVVT